MADTVATAPRQLEIARQRAPHRGLAWCRTPDLEQTLLRSILYTPVHGRRAWLFQAAEKAARIPLIDRAGIYTGLGELNAALDCLDQALAVRLPSLMLVRSDHRLAALHGEPQFDDLLRRIGLPGL